MTKSLLIVTPQNSLGSMLRSSLEETGQFNVFVAGDEPTALVQLKSENCEMTFLDVDLGMDALLEIGRALRTVQPDLDLVIVSDEDLPPALDPLRPWTLLRKPFYLPELMEMLGADTDSSAEETSTPIIEFPSDTPIPEGSNMLWLRDVNKAAQRLTRLTLESSAQAALITRGKKLWAYAGGLSQETANELVGIVSRTWDEQKSGDLLRFARLETTRAEHMLYATTLAEDVVLALVFDAETPFSTIRSQANSLAHSLAVEKTGAIKPVAADPAPKSRSKEPVPFDESDADLPSISEIISDIPSPIPVPQPLMRLDEVVDDLEAAPEVKPPEREPSALETRPSTPLAETRVVSRESSPAVPLRDMALDETVRHEVDELEVTAQSKVRQSHKSKRDLVLDETVEHEVDELEVTAQSKVKRPPASVRSPQPGELDETRAHSITEVAERVLLEPASPGLYHLNYACLLVPRFSSHHLTGDLASDLGEWLPKTCISFGWRLEFMAVRPEYVQWVVSVPPNTSPVYLMRIMRQQTSEKIFTEFPRMKKENPSGDFWAPGYLIMGGTQPHPQQLVKDYIKQTRKRQGDSQPRN